MTSSTVSDGCCYALGSTSPTWGWGSLSAGLTAGDIDGRVNAVWLARELAHTRRRMIVFFQHDADNVVPEFNQLVRTTDT